jgi:hypothetical protein
MISLKIAESKALHDKIIRGVCPFKSFIFKSDLFNLQESIVAFQSPEEASELLAKAMEHERWSRLNKDFSTLQLERAQEDVLSAEVQLKSAEEYMCSVINTIMGQGFTVKFIDSHTATVGKMNDSMFPTNLRGNLLTNMFMRNPYPGRVRFCHNFVT